MLTDYSQTKSYKSKSQTNEEVDRSQENNNEPYINPIVKHTFQSLPYIYGSNSNRKKKYNILMKNRFGLGSAIPRTKTKSVLPKKRLYTDQDQIGHQKQRGQSCLSNNKAASKNHYREEICKTVAKHHHKTSKSPQQSSCKDELQSQALMTPNSKRMVNLELMQNLAKPRQFCNKQYCSCKSLYHEYKEEIKKKLKQKNSHNSTQRSNLSKIKLPRLSVDLSTRSPQKLDDQESKHKVNFKCNFNSMQYEQQQHSLKDSCIMCNSAKKSDSNLQLKGILGLIKRKELEEMKKKNLLTETSKNTIGIQIDQQTILSQSHIRNEDYGTQADLTTKKLKTIDQQINTDLQQESKDFKYLQKNKDPKDSSFKQKKQPLEHLSHLKEKYKYKKRPAFDSKYGDNQNEEQDQHENEDQNNEDQGPYNKNKDKNRNSAMKRKKKGISDERSEQFDLDMQTESVISEKSLMNHLAKALANDGTSKSTIFKKLNNRQKQESESQFSINPTKGKSKKKKQHKTVNLIDEGSGLFAIPQEDEYVDYLKSYKPISKDFKIKNLVKSENFKILKYNNTLYFGETDANNKMHGQALFISPKEIFEGVYQNGIRMSGCERNIDGVYIGQFLNGMRHGQGKWLWNNGQIYEGQWKLGTKNGHGIWKSPKGDSYEGEWLLNRQQGKGIHRHKSSVYEGQFVQSLKQGHGKQKFINGDQYIGQYYRGKPHGKGKYVWKNGNYYEGEFKNGLREGFGKWQISTKAFYEGDFKGDFKHGKGKQVFENGDSYQGLYNQGVKTNGILIQSATGKKININGQSSTQKNTTKQLQKNGNKNLKQSNSPMTQYKNLQSKKKQINGETDRTEKI